MLSKRLSSVASFIEKEDKVIDIGCDHAYLDIYFIQNHCCKSTIATDINEKALKNAKNNIQKYHLDDEIRVILSDGISGINKDDYDTIVISGMGANTILHILNTSLDHVKKIVLQSNNDYPLLRKKMNEKGFYLQKEDVIEDHKKFYMTMLYLKDGKKSSKDEILFGKNPSQNSAYISFVLKSLEEMKCKIPKKKWLRQLKIRKYQSHFIRYIAKQKKQVH